MRPVGVIGGLGLMHAAPYLLSLIAYTPALSAPVQRRIGQLYGVGRPGRVAITFDDGPDPIGTPAIVRELDRLGWRATFFMLGEMTRRYPSLAREVAAAGHEIALHGDKHISFMRLPLPAALDDLRRSRDSIQDHTGWPVRFFRPPFGTLSASALMAAYHLDLEVVLWSSWGRDWRARATAQTVVADLSKGRIDGGTLLLHDSDCMSAPGSWRISLRSLPLLAEVIGTSALQVVPLGEHLARQPGQHSGTTSLTGEVNALGR